MTKFVSVKELNEQLKKFQDQQNQGVNTPIQQINLGEIDGIDIVFIAGLILWNKKYKTKFEISCIWTENSNKDKIIVGQYLRQYEETNKLSYKTIFPKFDGFNDVSKFSLVVATFAPIIYVNEKTMLEFFKVTEQSKISKELKELWYNRIEQLQNKNANSSEETYIGNSDLIRNQLYKFSPIHTFIFSIVYHKIDPFVEKRGRDKISEPDKIAEKIWAFTQEYVKGLYELAKNIVEHSTTKEGMITIHAYDLDNEDGNMDFTKVLETHVFDYGDEGIITKMLKDTKKLQDKAKENLDNTATTEAKERKERIYKAYEKDVKTLSGNYKISNFIDSNAESYIELEQQIFRDLAHFGLRKFYNLVKRHKGEMLISSVNDRFPDEKECLKKTIDIGTSYFFQIPFHPKNFQTVEKKQEKQENKPIGRSEEFKKLLQIKVVTINSLQPENAKRDIRAINKNTDEKFLIDLKIEIHINNRDEADKSLYPFFTELLGKGIEYFKGKDDIKYLAIDMDKLIMVNVSDIFRFLFHLSEECSQSLIVYNFKYEDYEEMIQDNIDFYELRKGTKTEVPFWSENKSILLFLKQNDFYYAADILFGKNGGEFVYINQLASCSAFNTVAFYKDKWENYKPSSDFEECENLKNLFHQNLLLPFDTILKASNNKPLFVSNLKRMIETDIVNDKNIDGYRVPNTHFRIGSKIHSHVFYYAKRLFQNSFHTLRIAFYLANKIKTEEGIERDKSSPITLIGYEIYSELLLSLVQQFLIHSGYINVTHFITIDIEDEIRHRPENNIFPNTSIIEKGKKTVKGIIIIPIASTGSTAVKIKEYIDNNQPYNDYKIEIEKKYNILQAKDNSQSFQKFINTDNQETIIDLCAEWELPESCSLCYGDQSIPLFETDKSSLTPTLIFSLPKGKNKKTDTDLSIDFDEINFDDEGVLIYKTTVRNNEHFLFSTNTAKLIKNQKNQRLIKEWLNKLKTELNRTEEIILKPIVIISPCHETNMPFVIMINDILFDSAATIVHHQNDVDYLENFILLNRHLFENEAKVFFVDDSLISGKSFFSVNYLFQYTAERTFDAIIVLNDKSTPEVHERIKTATTHLYSFVKYNLPPALKITDKKPLEHEETRYRNLSNIVLHDTLIQYFYTSAESLSENSNKIKKEIDEAKNRRHIRMFKVTHKIYEYFAENPDEKDLKKIETIDKFIEKLNLKFNDGSSELEQKFTVMKVLSQYPFLLYKPLREQTFAWHKYWLKKFITNLNDNDFNYEKFSKLKFLIRRAVFLGNYYILDKSVLSAINRYFLWIENTKVDEIESKKSAIELKNREIESKKSAIELKNCEIELKNCELKNCEIESKKMEQSAIEVTKELSLTKEFERSNLELSLNALKSQLNALKSQLNELESNQEQEKQNKLDFNIFLVQHYVELMHKNSWCAVNLLENINKVEFSTLRGKQFVRMLKIEAAAVMNDFYDLILKENKRGWTNIFKETDNNTLNVETEKIIQFFDKKENINIKNSNKFEICKQTLKIDLIDKTPFANFLWIKQLLTSDFPEESYLPKEIDYQTKINAAIEKMKGFFNCEDFNCKDLGAFFIVSTIKNENYALYDDGQALKKNDGQNELNKADGIYYILTEFLKGEPVASTKEKKTYNQEEKNGDCKTIIEYERQDMSDTWKDLYTVQPDGKQETITFLPQEQKWLLLVRISDHNVKTNKWNTLGLLGFYSKENLFNNILPKQLLMLLRRDMGAFIKKHHKNDEFLQLLLEKQRYRFAYLAGHGRLTLQRLASEDENHLKYVPFIRTIEKLQYMFATKYLLPLPYSENTNLEKDDLIKELLNDFTSSEITNEHIMVGIGESNKKIGIQELAKKIYETYHIENKVGVDVTVYVNDVDVTVETPPNFSFKYSQEILFYICFELIINAKKNRFHFLETCNKEIKNKLAIAFNVSNDGQQLTITVKGTGAKFDHNIAKKINIKESLKERENEQEGLFFINTLIDKLSKGSVLRVDNDDEPACLSVCENCNNKDKCAVYENIIKITLNTY